MIPATRVRWAGIAVVTAVVLVALLHVWHLRWVSEDAYISFRYARNLVEGHGLVFNPGERVEGYTNLLWTLLLAVGLRSGAGVDTIATLLGLLFTAFALVGLRELWQRLVPGPATVPVALIALALNYTWASFGTSGLETSLLGALIAFTFVASSRGRPLAAGALTALAMMTRPDAALLAPPALLCLALGIESPRRRLVAVAQFAAALAALFAPYFLWRYGYYGHLFPNTYYAKGASLPYYSQGLVYVWGLVQRYHLWLLLPWPAVAAISAIRHRRWCPLTVAIASFCLLHTAYVVRVGGDFMEGRFLVPVLPFVYLLVTRSLRELIRDTRLRGAALAIVVLTVVADREMIEPGRIENGITDERSWASTVSLWLREGETLGRHLPPGTLVATDAIGAFGYASRLPIVDTLGLADETVAHLPLERRSRPGHEKSAPVDYLRARGVEIIRDGREMYRTEREPDLSVAGTRYYVTAEDAELHRRFRLAAEELTGSGSGP